MELPTNNHAECVLIGRMLCSINAVNSAIDCLVPEDFCTPEHCAYFKAMQELYNKDLAIDPYTVCAKVSEMNPKYADVSYLFGLTQFHATDDAQYFIEIIKDCSQYRKFMLLMAEFMPIAEHKKCSPPDLQSQMMKRLDEIFTQKGLSTEYTMQRIFADYRQTGMTFLEYAQNQQERKAAGLNTINGHKSRFPILDRTLDGFNRGHFIIVGARPKVGKSTFLLNLIHNFLLEDIKVGMFSIEMTAHDVYGNLLHIASQVEQEKTKHGGLSHEDYQTLASVQQFLEAKTIVVDDQESIPISQLQARARRWVNSLGIQVICIDYISLINPGIKFSSKQESIQYISLQLRALAKSLRVPIICACQLNRESERNNRPPQISDLRESGQIEQDAHQILLLHRPSADQPINCPSLMNVHIAKNRFGSEGVISFDFQKSTGRIYELGIAKEVRNKSGQDVLETLQG